MAWSDDEIIEEQENSERYVLNEELPAEEPPPDLDEEDSPDEAVSERKKLKRELEAEALKRLEDAARTEEDFRKVVAWWDRLDANRERRERYHEISRSGDGLPLEFGECEDSLLYAGTVERMLMKQRRQGDFIETIYFRPSDIQELVTERYLWYTLLVLKDEQKVLLFQRAILKYSTLEIGELRGQTDRNIRKVWNTLLKKIRKNALTWLEFKLRLGDPLTLEEKAFWEGNKKSPLDE